MPPKLRLPYVTFLLGISVGLIPTIWNHLHFFTNSSEGYANEVGNQDSELLRSSEAVFNLTMTSVRIFCIVLTTKNNHYSRAKHALDTWAAKCDGHIFASDFDDPQLGALAFHNSSSYVQVWTKVRRSFQWVYDEHLNNFDWFIKADDDSFLIVENLKLFLAKFNPKKESLYIGRHFNDLTKQVKRGYLQGGAGYVISRKGLEDLIEKGFNPIGKSNCPSAGSTRRKDFYEDVNMGRCMAMAAVRLVHGLDASGRQRFLYMPPGLHIQPDKTNTEGMKKYDVHGLVTGWDCCSEEPISFHNIKNEKILQMQYLLYNVNVYSPMTAFTRGNIADFRNKQLELLRSNGYYTEARTER